MQLSLQYCSGQNLFAYEKQTNFIPYIPDYVDIPAYTTNPSYGNKIEFEIDKRFDGYMGKTVLGWNRSALTGVNAGAYFNDWEGFATIEYVEFWYNNSVFFRTDGEELFLETQRECNLNERRAAGQLQNGNFGT